MTVAGFLATVAGLLVRFGVYSGMMGGRSRDNTAVVFLVVVVASIVVYVLSFLLLRALSRYREFAADRGAAIMTGAPAQLADALAVISGGMSRIPTDRPARRRGHERLLHHPGRVEGLLAVEPDLHPPARREADRAPHGDAGHARRLPDRDPLEPPPWASSTSCADSVRPAGPTSTACSRSGRRRSRSRCRWSCARPAGRACASRPIEAGVFEHLVREIEELLRGHQRRRRHHDPPPRRRHGLLVGRDRGPRPGGPGHDHPRGQPVARGARVLGAAAVRRLRLRRPARRGRPRLRLQARARSTRSPRGTASAATTPSSCASSRWSRPSCRSSPSSSAGTPIWDAPTAQGA